ncbi:putative flavonoid 3',5'-hydroxylase [Rosa chinensis]|uniref:Putative flavonoid 3',5'-hydroxylase n=1 Tax=Rosa chinensis TaxID=74649 RepID=A0A2P6RKR5_ROSCH|nr:putative flavonoid 3',5'-hydroxylase [Rosa chinensis]
MKAFKKKFDRFHDHVFGEHRSNKEGVKEFVPKDIVDDLIAGGTDTSATTVDWAMSELMKQPHLIQKAIEELDRVIGRETWVEDKDIAQLPCIDAIMKETMRKHPVACNARTTSGS